MSRIKGAWMKRYGHDFIKQWTTHDMRYGPKVPEIGVPERIGKGIGTTCALIGNSFAKSRYRRAFSWRATTAEINAKPHLLLGK